MLLSVMFSILHIFEYLSQNITIVDVPNELKVLTNSSNMLHEFIALLNLEQKRRTEESCLNEAEKEGVVKKSRKEKRNWSNPYQRKRYNLQSSEDSSDNSPGTSRQ